MSYSLGIDVGGTFTDFIEVDQAGEVTIVKTPSTPDRPADGVVDGLNKLAADHASVAAYLGEVDLIVHGTTITTNAVITGNFAKTGYITTKGFRHILNSRRGIKRRAFTAKEAPPKPIVPQYLVCTVDERIDKNGDVITPLNEDDVRRAARLYAEENVEAIAVNLMFSFVNPAHEEQIAGILAEELPDTSVSLSSQVLPYVRMYERGSTTVFNACVSPLLGTYIDDLQMKLAQSGFAGRLLTMQSNGGVMSPELVKHFGANTLLSGPASGPVAALFFSAPHGLRDLITIDMGGTSLDASLIQDGRPSVTKSSEVAEYALAIPSLDIRAIGAGGGSIAFVDQGGVLNVGPASAGAVPGPAAYGLGGEQPTVTDANLVLGYLNPGFFLGGERSLHDNLAQAAVKRNVADPLGISNVQAAAGIVQLVNSQMANGVRKVSIERGFDPRDAALVVAGGAGPLHACGIAEELGLELVLIPKTGSVLCATGMLTTDLRHDLVRFAAMSVDAESGCVERLNALRNELIPLGRKLLEDERVTTDRQRFEFAADMMFEGQFNVLETVLPRLSDGPVTNDDIAGIQEAFRAHHEDVYGYALPDSPIEIQSLRLSAVGISEPPAFRQIEAGGASADHAIKSSRAAWFVEKEHDTNIYEGATLRAGNEIAGPAIIEEPTTTILVSPRWRLQMDNLGSYLLWPEGLDLGTIRTRLTETKH